MGQRNRSWGGIHQACKDSAQSGDAACVVSPAQLLLLSGGLTDCGSVVERKTDSPKGVTMLAAQLRYSRAHALLQPLLQVGTSPSDLSVGQLRDLVEQPCSSAVLPAWQSFAGSVGQWQPKPDTGIEVVPEPTAGTQQPAVRVGSEVDVAQFTGGGAQVGQLGCKSAAATWVVEALATNPSAASRASHRQSPAPTPPYRRGGLFR